MNLKINCGFITTKKLFRLFLHIKLYVCLSVFLYIKRNAFTHSTLGLLSGYAGHNTNTKRPLILYLLFLRKSIIPTLN